MYPSFKVTFDLIVMQVHQDNNAPALSYKVHPVSSCATLLFPSSTMAIGEYHLSLRHLNQTDLVFVDAAVCIFHIQ
ncbi:hypothetical protein [Colwellia sp. E2M01]|uniref:hypothetical protein n=1 Tax=Colwellia sp. E2M01 TaxID=2841561 RepID=UPI001C0904B3|nr:hypothetical protein [Colwellia sp. E2M01]MBU2869142.1 hypothetical protein [Colwellia sp. E2M01]